jgi:hypothetical protein
MGKITYVAEHGNYDITEKVLEVEFQGQKKTFTMMHVSETRQTLLRCLKCLTSFLQPFLMSCAPSAISRGRYNTFDCLCELQYFAYPPCELDVRVK